MNLRSRPAVFLSSLKTIEDLDFINLFLRQSKYMYDEGKKKKEMLLKKSSI